LVLGGAVVLAGCGDLRYCVSFQTGEDAGRSGLVIVLHWDDEDSWPGDGSCLAWADVQVVCGGHAWTTVLRRLAEEPTSEWRVSSLPAREARVKVVGYPVGEDQEPLAERELSVRLTPGATTTVRVACL